MSLLIMAALFHSHSIPARADGQDRDVLLDDSFDDSFDVLDDAISFLDDLQRQLDPDASPARNEARDDHGGTAQASPGASDARLAASTHLSELFRRAISPAKFYELILKPNTENFAKCDGTYELNLTVGRVNGKPVYINKKKDRLLAASGTTGWTVTSLGYLEEVTAKSGGFGGYHFGGGIWPDGKEWQKYIARREGRKYGAGADETSLDEHVHGHLKQLRDRAPVLDGLFSVLQNNPPGGPPEIADLERMIWEVWQWHADSALRERMREAIALMETEATYNIALDVLDRLIAEDPAYAEAYNKRAHLRFKMGEKMGGVELANADLSQAIKLEPRHFGAKTNQAVGFLAGGRYTEAYVTFQAALKLHPHSVEIREGLDSFKQLLAEEASGESEVSGIERASKIVMQTQVAMANAKKPREPGPAIGEEL